MKKKAVNVCVFQTCKKKPKTSNLELWAGKAVLVTGAASVKLAPRPIDTIMNLPRVMTPFDSNTTLYSFSLKLSLSKFSPLFLLNFRFPPARYDALPVTQFCLNATHSKLKQISR